MRNKVISQSLFLLFLWIFLVECAHELYARKKVVLSNEKNITSQISILDKGAIYIIAESIDFKNNTVKLPEGAILQFEGGCFLNGELIGNNSTIIAGRYEIFREISLSGKWLLDCIPVEWFGAIPNISDYDCSSSINRAISCGVVIGVPVHLGAGTYYTKSTIDIPNDGTLVGSAPSSTIISFYHDAAIGVYLHGRNITLKSVCVTEHRMGRKGICIKVGDTKNAIPCTRGYIEDVKATGGKRGLDLEYQWCNKISGVNCCYNDIGLYANRTTPYVENAIIEANYECGLYSEGSGVKLYNAVIEGNKVGCVLNGKENFFNNCYFEGNTSSSRNKHSEKDVYGFDVEGGHIFAGEQTTINNLIMIGCHIVNVDRYNNTIKIDKCLNFTSIGCNLLEYLDITENCHVKYLDKTYTTVDGYGEYTLASRIHNDVYNGSHSVFYSSNFSGVKVSDMQVSLDEKGYYIVHGNKSHFVIDEEGNLLCFSKDKV